MRRPRAAGPPVRRRRGRGHRVDVAVLQLGLRGRPRDAAVRTSSPAWSGSRRAAWPAMVRVLDGRSTRRCDRRSRRGVDGATVATPVMALDRSRRPLAGAGRRPRVEIRDAGARSCSTTGHVALEIGDAIERPVSGPRVDRRSRRPASPWPTSTVSRLGAAMAIRIDDLVSTRRDGRARAPARHRPAVSSGDDRRRPSRRGAARSPPPEQRHRAAGLPSRWASSRSAGVLPVRRR